MIGEGEEALSMLQRRERIQGGAELDEIRERGADIFSVEKRRDALSVGGEPVHEFGALSRAARRRDQFHRSHTIPPLSVGIKTERSQVKLKKSKKWKNYRDRGGFRGAF